MHHEHEWTTTPYDEYELRCAVKDCCTAKILPGNPRYCALALDNILHTPHEHEYSYRRHNDPHLTTGSYWCGG